LQFIKGSNIRARVARIRSKDSSFSRTNRVYPNWCIHHFH